MAIPGRLLLADTLGLDEPDFHISGQLYGLFVRFSVKSHALMFR